MPRPGFYNDNEYRAYPFVYAVRPAPRPTAIEQSVVDAGFIMGLDADFNAAADSVWLDQISRSGNTFEFVFKTDAAGALNVPLTFRRNVAADEWETEFANTEPAEIACAEEPVWEGFLTTGSLSGLATQVAAGATVTFAKNEYQIELARIQNMAKSYLRSINLGNYERTRIPACEQANNINVRPVILNATCLKGNVKLKEGYQCQITQNTQLNTIDLSAGENVGAEKDAVFCENGSELPQHPDEQKQPNEKFYSGGPACDELIFTINGIGGKNINILGGAGITIKTTDSEHQLKIELQSNAQNLCQANNDAQ